MAKKTAKKPAAGKSSKKRKHAEPESLAEMRGVGTFDTNELLIFVRRPVEEVAAAFKKHRKLKTLVPNALGKTITVRDPSYLIYRLQGHAWTVIDTYCARGKYVNTEDAKALSKALECRTIFYGNSDTASATGYDLYDNGDRLERFYCFEDVQFESKLRKTKAPKDGPDIYPFVERFMKAHDAFAPSWSIYFGSICNDPGDKVKLEFPAADELIRLDYVSA